MVNQNANFYGILLVLLVLVIWIGLLIPEPQITGFAVLENKFSEFDIEIYDNEQHVCADGSFFQECSSLIKGKFCHLGKLVDYCELCGCEPGEVCKNRECIQE